MDPFSDERLVESCKRGNREHCRMIFERYKAYVARIIYLFFGNNELAEDLTQDVFLKVHRGLKKFRGEASLKSWIRTITTNTCRDQIRHKKKMPVDIVPIDFFTGNDDDGLIIEIADDEGNTDPQIKIEKKQREIAVRSMVKELKEMDRDVLMLWLANKKYDDIARITGLPKGTVGSKISEIKRKLKIKLGGVELGL